MHSNRRHGRIDDAIGYLKDISWVLSANVVSQLIAVGILPLLSRIYTPKDFAVQNMLVQVAGFMTICLAWRYEQLINLPATDAGASALGRLINRMAFWGMVLLSPLVWVWRLPLATAMGLPELENYLPVGVVTAAFTVWASTRQSYMQRIGTFRLSSASEVAGKSSFAATAYLFQPMLSGAWGLVLAGLAANAVKLATLVFGSGRVSEDKSADGREIARKFVHLASTLSGSHLLMTLTGLIPSIALARRYGGEVLGQYGLVAATLFLPTVLLSGALGQVFYQRAAAAWVSGKSFHALWMQTVKWLVIGALPACLIFSWIAEWAYPYFFGSQWRVAGQFAVLLLPAAFFSLISSPLDRGCLVVGAWHYVLGWHTLRAASTALVAWGAIKLDWSISQFLIGLSAQMSFCYLLDLLAGWHFSRLIPAQAGVGGS